MGDFVVSIYREAANGTDGDDNDCGADVNVTEKGFSGVSGSGFISSASPAEVFECMFRFLESMRRNQKH